MDVLLEFYLKGRESKRKHFVEKVKMDFDINLMPEESFL
jgi:hypothetical protein